MLKKLGLKENESINHPWINKAIERAQKKVEARNFDIRKTLIKFDDVMNDQRQVIFGQRLSILKSKQVTQIIKNFLTDSISNLVLAKEEFSKTGDQKLYLTSIKSLIGNVVDDSELIKKSSLDKNKFKEFFIDIFNKKEIKELRL